MPLNAIALISGGKDSLYTILHTLRNGHNVVALANLHPPVRRLEGEGEEENLKNKKKEKSAGQQPQGAGAGSAPIDSTQAGHKGDDNVANNGSDNDDDDELNSQMYQTAGHAAVPLYADALGLPLYRAPIRGAAVRDAVDYEPPPLMSAPAAAEAAAAAAPVGREAGGVIVSLTERTRHASTEQGEGDNGAQGAEGDDETECMYHLLARIRSAHPEVDAVCAGAILSSYQRTRVESVAGRLGLVVLAWLWEYPVLPPPAEASSSLSSSDGDDDLLSAMATVGCDARIVKVAGGGLGPELLWANVADRAGRMRRQLRTAAARFANPAAEEDGAVAAAISAAAIGEGGEYETLAVDGPGFLWRGRLELDDPERVRVVHDSGAAWMAFGGGVSPRCVRKTAEERDDGVTLADVRVPGYWDGFVDAVRGALAGRGWEMKDDESVPLSLSPSPSPLLAPVAVRRVGMGRLLSIANLAAPSDVPSNSNTSPSSATATAQMTAIATQLRTTLASHGLTPDDIVFTTLLLRDMGAFGSVNAVYGKLFRRPNPAARATVAVGGSTSQGDVGVNKGNKNGGCCLPEGVDVVLSAVADMGDRCARQGLHVQSRSYWAPANIGPYSQAIFVPASRQHGQGEKDGDNNDGNDGGGDSSGGVVYVAGQIPLDAPSMTPGFCSHGPAAFLNRATLAAQHLWRIGRKIHVDVWLTGVAYLTEGGDMAVPAKARVVCDVWRELHRFEDEGNDGDEEEEDIDPWDLKYGLYRHQPPSVKRGRNRQRPGHRQSIPSRNVCFQNANANNGSDDDMNILTTPPLLAVHVHQLPRAVDVEWQALGSRTAVVRSVYWDEPVVTTHGHAGENDGDGHDPAANNSSLLPVSHASGPGFGAVIQIGVPFHPTPPPSFDSESSGAGAATATSRLMMARAKAVLDRTAAAGKDSGDGEGDGEGQGDAAGRVTVYAAVAAGELDYGGMLGGTAQVVPCRAVWGSDGRGQLRRLAAGIVCSW